MKQVTFTLRVDDYTQEFATQQALNTKATEGELKLATLEVVLHLPADAIESAGAEYKAVKLKGHYDELREVSVVVDESLVDNVKEYCRLRDLPVPVVTDMK